MTLELSFAKVLKALRAEKKISQLELANKSNLDRTYISMLERGIHQPTLTTLYTLSKALQIKPSEIVRRIEQEIEMKEQTKE